LVVGDTRIRATIELTRRIDNRYWRPESPLFVATPAVLRYAGIDPATVDPGSDFLADRSVATNELVIPPSMGSDEDVAVTISDDGPGFAPTVMDRIGEPYVRSSKRRRMNPGSETTGLGLGVFIAKTLLERSGASIEFENRTFPDRGAVIRVRWPRSDFERVPGPAALE
jgi:signal transduction histidine kinase